MTNIEIAEGLKKADALLDEYKKIAKPIAEELARRKSRAVFSSIDDAYDGDLGCWEAGIDTICLHLNDGYEEKAGAYEAEARLRAQFFSGIIRNIILTGHH